jgi:hypothetical protein
MRGNPFLALKRSAPTETMQILALVFQDIWSPFFSSLGDLTRYAISIAAIAGIVLCGLFLANLLLNRKFNVWLLLIGGGLLLIFGIGPAIGLFGVRVPFSG